MLRGNRWPFLALLGSVALLVIAILSRTGRGTEFATTAPTPTAAPITRRPAMFTEALIGQVRKLNPLLVGPNQADRDITSLIFEGLVGTNQYGEYTPLLAEDWTISKDGLTYEFRLRRDVLWQDGVPFTARDVIFTIEIMSAPDFPGPAYLRDFWQTVECEAMDDYRVRCKLAQPLAPFLDFMRIGIVPAHVLENTPPTRLATHPFNLAPIGTGPYQLERLYVDEDRIGAVELRLAPTYAQRADALPYQIDRMLFRLFDSAEDALRAFANGELTSIAEIPPDLLPQAEGLPGLSLYNTLRPAVGVVLLNFEVEAFRDLRVREALAESMDKVGLVERHLEGRAVPANSPIVFGSWAWVDVEWPPYDPASATERLAAARVDEVPPFTLICPDDPDLSALAAEMVTQWGEIGIEAGIEALPWDVLESRLEARDFQAALVELDMSGMADPDPYVFWDQGEIEGGQNYAGVDDRVISEALERARRDPNGLHRAIRYQEFQEAFAERVPALVLYYPIYTYGVDSSVSGVQLGYLSDPSDRFRTLYMWQSGDRPNG